MGGVSSRNSRGSPGRHRDLQRARSSRCSNRARAGPPGVSTPPVRGQRCTCRSALCPRSREVFLIATRGHPECRGRHHPNPPPSVSSIPLSAAASTWSKPSRTWSARIGAQCRALALRTQPRCRYGTIPCIVEALCERVSRASRRGERLPATTTQNRQDAVKTFGHCDVSWWVGSKSSSNSTVARNADKVGIPGSSGGYDPSFC